MCIQFPFQNGVRLVAFMTEKKSTAKILRSELGKNSALCLQFFWSIDHHKYNSITVKTMELPTSSRNAWKDSDVYIIN